MKKIAFLFFVSILALGITVSAQNQREGGKRGGNMETRQAPNASDRAERLAKDLSLTDDQKAKVTELYQKQEDDMKKFRSDNNREDPDFREKMKQFRDSQDSELKAIIGDEKFQQLQTIREERMQKMREARKNN